MPDEKPNQQPETPMKPEAEPDEQPEAPTEEAMPDALLAQVQQERDELEQRLLRTAADYQNFVKRSHQNVASAREQQLIDVARNLVTVLDHFDRALDVDPEKASVKDVLSGLKIVHDELLSVLSKYGIERIEARPGEPFDPNRHEALMRQPHDDYTTDQVVQQYQPGYAMGEKTIRAAQVSLAQ